MRQKNPNWALSFPKPICRKEVTVKDAFAGLPNVVANSGKEATDYISEESEYTKILKDDTFWRRKELGSGKITYHMPMKHRACTLERFSLLQQGESLKDLFEKYTGEEREKLQERRVLPKKCLLSEITD